MDQQAAAQAAKAIEQSLYEKLGSPSGFICSEQILTDKMANLMDDTSDSAKYSAEIVDNTDYLIEDLKASMILWMYIIRISRLPWMTPRAGTAYQMPSTMESAP